MNNNLVGKGLVACLVGSLALHGCASKTTPNMAQRHPEPLKPVTYTPTPVPSPYPTWTPTNTPTNTPTPTYTSTPTSTPEPAPKPTQPAQELELSALESELLNDINQIRAPMLFSQDLYMVAKQRVNDIISSGNFSHDINGNGRYDVSEVVEELGLCKATRCLHGELLGRVSTHIDGKELCVEEMADILMYGYQNNGQKEKGFMTSQSHNDILLNQSFANIGIYSGFNDNEGKIYVAVVLGL
jgi:uncharacterized protein YkwD